MKAVPKAPSRLGQLYEERAGRRSGRTVNSAAGYRHGEYRPQHRSVGEWGNSRAEYFIEGTQPTQQAVREVGTTLTDGGGETHELF